MLWFHELDFPSQRSLPSARRDVLSTLSINLVKCLEGVTE